MTITAPRRRQPDVPRRGERFRRSDRGDERREISLDDKYLLDEGRILLTGVQADQPRNGEVKAKLYHFVYKVYLLPGLPPGYIPLRARNDSVAHRLYALHGRLTPVAAVWFCPCSSPAPEGH